VIEILLLIAIVIILFLLATGLYLSDSFELYGLATICSILFIITFAVSWYVVKTYSLGGN